MQNLAGSIDSASAIGVTGWAADTEDTSQALTVELLVDEILVATGIANQPRPDLASVTGGSVNHGFDVRFPDTLPVASLASVRVRVRGADWEIPGSPANVYMSPLVPRHAFFSRAAQNTQYRYGFDYEMNNAISGWIVFASDLARRCVVSLEAGGAVICKLVADEERLDLVALGIGDGRYGFSFTLPDYLRSSNAIAVTVYEYYSGLCLTPEQILVAADVPQTDFGRISPIDELLSHSALPRICEEVSASSTCIIHSRPPIGVVSGSSCLALIATRNYLPYARVTARTFLEHHPSFQALLLIVDGVPEDAASFPEGQILLVSELGLTGWEWFSAKFSASELSNALKPVFLRQISLFFDYSIYLDCDIVVFSPLSELITAVLHYDIVLIPHMFTPVPRPEHYWSRPNRGDSFNAGLVNGGCFAMRLQACGMFLQQWEEMNFAVGAFYDGAGFQTDQQHLNWALVSANNVHVLQDPRYNVAYWNLHERDLRVEKSHSGLQFTVGHRPLGFFHFSGYDIHDPFRLSTHDGRNSVYDLPAVAHLLPLYSEMISNDSQADCMNQSYAFDVLPNGFQLNSFIRQIVKRYEVYFPRFDVRTLLGANAFCSFLMKPLSATRSLLPLVSAVVWENRPDLWSFAGDANTAIAPVDYWRWFNRHAGTEYGVGAQFLIDRFRKLIVTNELRGFCEDMLRAADIQTLEFLGRDRLAASDLLSRAGRSDYAEILLSAERETLVCNELSHVFALYMYRDDLRTLFPDILGADQESFANWLMAHSAREHNCPRSAVQRFQALDVAKSLAAIFSYVSRTEHIWDSARGHFLGENLDPFLRALLASSGEGLEYDVDDVLVFRFLHSTRRQRLVPLYLEFPFVREHVIANRLPHKNLDALPIEIRGESWARAGAAVHASFFGGLEAILDNEVRLWGARLLNQSGDVVGFLRGAKTDSVVRLVEPIIRQSITKARGAGIQGATLERRLQTSRAVPSVNIFGYFFSDIGVGESSRGLANAIEALRPVNRVPYYTAQMQSGISVDKLFQRFDYLSDTNVFVSYPHQREDLLSRMRPEQVIGRRNIAHLAWEQKDANPWWKVVYDRYDEIWSISTFAATPFEELFPGRVRVVPNVLDFATFPEDDYSEIRLRGDKIRFLYIFDAGSSMERKNPEGVIHAFAKAFAHRRYRNRVSLTLKIGGMYRPDYFFRVGQLRELASRSGLAIKLDGRMFSREETLRYISAHDCYLSLHRSEGFGYTMAEAMAFGLPVIATGYSGNLDFMSEDNSYLVPAQEVFVRNPDGPFQRGSVWGDPDLDVSVSYLRQVVDRPTEALERAAKGKADVFEKLSPAAVARVLAPSFAEKLLAS